MPSPFEGKSLLQAVERDGMIVYPLGNCPSCGKSISIFVDTGISGPKLNIIHDKSGSDRCRH